MIFLLRLDRQSHNGIRVLSRGELLHIGIEEGGTAPVDSLLTIIGTKGEDIKDMIGGAATTTTQAESLETSDETQAPVAIVESNEEKTAMRRVWRS